MGVLLNDNGNLIDLTGGKPGIDERVTDLEDRTTALENKKIDVPQPSDTEPQAPGEASAGTSEKYAREDHVHPSNAPAAATATPKANGTAAVGTSTKYAREDHVHPSDTSSGVVSTIIYPNGGSASSPKNVTTNQRIEMDNPYPGYFVQCDAQVQINGSWGNVGWVFASDVASGCGISARQLLPSDKIIVLAGSYSVALMSKYQGAPHNYTGQYFTTIPCRVIVTRLGKMPD